VWPREGGRFCASSEVSDFVCQVVYQVDRGLNSRRYTTPDAFQAQTATTLTSLCTRATIEKL